MKVIGAGLPRTATTTQMVALEHLGFGPCYHMRDLMADLDQCALWHRAVHGEAIWDEVFDGYGSTTDWPSAFFYRELIEVYPDAKVILSIRDAQAWERSMRDTVWAIYHSDNVMHHLSRARYHVDPQWRAWIDLMTEMMWAEPHGPFAGSFNDRDQLIAGYHRWNEEVQDTVPADRLIVWDPAEGWGPLCDFLEVECPVDPLPRVNDAHSFRNLIIPGAIDSLQTWWDGEREEAPAPT